MANISNYLTQIMSAIYGKDVRSSIHDAISAINDESKQAILDASGAKNSAVASAMAAETSASSALSASSSASSAKTAAQAAQAAAESAKSAAVSSASSALNSASNASVSEANAKQYSQDAQAALDSVDNVLSIKTTLEENHAVYQILTDSNKADLLDSNGNQILGRILFADAGDIVTLKNTVSALESLVQFLVRLLLNTRITKLESNSVEVEDAITNLQEHALLDDTFN